MGDERGEIYGDEERGLEGKSEISTELIEEGGGIKILQE